ncbi:MAG TPA: hypothetical protein VL346_01570 [Acidobacteriaceae bacterium]|nr:hypothetical protein [Acidobacteriaceae bacterium]
MTETTLSAIAPTPLAAALSADGGPALAAYHGMLTPRLFTPNPTNPAGSSESALSEAGLSGLDAPEEEIAALVDGVAVHDLGWRRRVEVRGEDRFRWLSGMVTNAVEQLAENSGAYNLVLNAQGRIQGDALVWRSADALEMELDAAQYDALLAHLDQFIIMDDVELAPRTEITALGMAGPKAAALLAGLGVAVPDADLSFADSIFDGQPVRVARECSPFVPRFTLWIDALQFKELWLRLKALGAVPVGSSALETLRVLEGTAAYGQDIQSRDLAQETSLNRALNFTKGCYLGQEIVERIRSRGQVHRHLRQLEIFPGSGELPSPGAELQFNGKPAGALTSVAAVQLQGARRIFAIGMIRAEAELAERNEAPLTYPGGEARLLQAPPRLSAS